MTELEELIEQKREIEAKIKAAKNKGVVMTDGAKLDQKRKSKYNKEGDWQIAVRCRILGMPSIGWYSRGFACVVNGGDRAGVIAQLPLVIADLQELEAKLKLETEEKL